MTTKDQTHELARQIVELYLWGAKRKVTATNEFDYRCYPEFIQKHSLGTTSRPNTNHSYDIVTDKEIIEIDDYHKHSKKSQKINDGIAGEYITTYHPEFKFYRLIKEEIVNEKGQIQPDCYSYLREHLF